MNRIVTAGLVCSLVSLGATLSAHHLIFDLLAHFRIQYIVLIFGVLCLSLGRRQFWKGLALVFCLSVHTFYVVRSQLPLGPVVDTDSPSIRVMSSNLLASNTEYHEHVRYIRDVDPDVIVFQEYTSAWAEALSSALSEYEHKVSVSLESPFGIALFSKLPIIRSNLDASNNTHRPGIDSVVSTASGTLRIIGAHPPPPVSQQLYEERNAQLQALANVTNSEDLPLVVLGDLNITPWSAHFREFVEIGRLRDGRRGFGILPTWPAGFLVLQIPIDHVIVNDGVVVLDMGSSDKLASDHRSIWADVGLQ